MEIRVREVRLPGMGMRYELDLGEGRQLFVVAERAGERHLGMHRDGDSPDWEITLSSEQAVILASLLLGARFTLDTRADASATGDEVVVDTVELTGASPAIGLTATEIELPGSDATVIAVISDATPDLVEDESSYRCRAGDRAVVAARAATIDTVVAHLRGAPR